MLAASTVVGGRHAGGRIGPILCWAIVFADVGSSVYYVPGILRETPGVGHLAAWYVLAVAATCAGLAAKYAEIAARFPAGGGVVSVAAEAFGPAMGCLGGLLIVTDYFLAAAIGALSAVQYLGSVVPLGADPLPLACAALVVLGLVNLLGVRASAVFTLVTAAAGLMTQLLVVAVVSLRLSPSGWEVVRGSLAAVGPLAPRDVLTGFGGAWLAFSGLESLSQLSPALRAPRRRVARLAIALVFGSVAATAPVLTAFSTTLLGASAPPDRLISELAGAAGGAPLRALVALAAAALLLFSANAAMLGCYHVVLALARRGYLPRALVERGPSLDTPHRAIGISAAVPVVVLLATRGDVESLGALYAFGLLGAFFLSSAGLDSLRWREGQRGPAWLAGILVSLAVLVGWTVNLRAKPMAALFGGGITAAGALVAVVIRRRASPRSRTPRTALVLDFTLRAIALWVRRALADLADVMEAYTSLAPDERARVRAAARRPGLRRTADRPPCRAGVHHRLGLELAARGEIDAAVRELERAVFLAPGERRYRDDLVTVRLLASREAGPTSPSPTS